MDLSNCYGMDTISNWPTRAEARSDLRDAIKILNARGLVVAARWSAELLFAIPADDVEDSVMDDTQTSSFKGKERAEVWAPDDDEEDEDDAYLLGRTYFDSRDFERAYGALAHSKGSKSRFIRLYSRYMAIERKIMDNVGVVLGPTDFSNKHRQDHVELLAEIGVTKDPFELFLKAMLQARLSSRLASIDSLVQSVNLWEFNWSAWRLLDKLIDGIDELRTVLPRVTQTGFMSRCFLLQSTLEAHNASISMENTIKCLHRIFPGSIHLRSQRALISYHLRDFETCEELFDDIFAEDPHRTEDVDTYSNILYVMEKRAKLTALAQRFTASESGGAERMRPEVCCLLGNYWSLRGEHEKAILEFRKAIKLDPGYLSAWTLMGHEYVELKNTHAAIESYRRAIDCNAKDYRAWYGLGQTYEVLEMHLYSLHYYQRATSLRPYDSRMWSALANTYEKLGRRPEAIKTLKRALLNAGSEDAPVVSQLAALLDVTGQYAEAVRYHRRLVEEILEDEGEPSDKLAKSFIYMARYEIEIAPADDRDLTAAKEYLEHVMRLNVQERDDAKELLRRLAVAERQEAAARAAAAATVAAENA